MQSMIAPRAPESQQQAQARVAGWFNLCGAAQIRSHPWLEKLTLALFAACVIGQLWVLQGNVKDSAQSVPCPIRYAGSWRTDKHRYRAGDPIRFGYLRASTEGDLILWQIDAFENQDTGELYPGAILGRAVERAGTEHVRQVRELPEKLAPGTYRLKGWISAQTSRRSLPTRFESEPFEVVKP